MNALVVTHTRGISRRIVLILFLLPIGVSLAQRTYYVANSGNDANDGRSANSPIQSLTKVNSIQLNPGDKVLFRRGDTFRGTLQVRQSGTSEQPVQFDAYETGAKPILAGSVPVQQWTQTGPTIWQATCSACGNNVTGVYANGVAQPLGRYPNPGDSNRGNLTVETHVGVSQLTSQQPLTANWTGGELVVRSHYWIIDRALITGQRDNTLLLRNASTYPITDGWGFFIQNHPATLDRQGEWFYNPATQTIQMYLERGNPNEQLITATASDKVIELSNVAFVTIQNLNVMQARSTNLYALNVTDLNLSNNDFTNSGEDGILIDGKGSNVSIANNSITNSNNNGVNIGNYQNVTFRQNTIRQTGLLAGRGKSGDGQYNAFQSFSTLNTLIENNIIDSVGYCGLSVQNNTVVRQNQIANFCMTKCDGGGIYLWNGNQVAMHNIRLEANIIQRGIGTPGGLADDTPGGAHGIFLDDCVESIDVLDNTIAHCQGLGIYLHAVSGVNLLRNTIFNNSVGQLMLYHYDAPCHPRNNVISQNVLMARTATQPVACYMSGLDDLARFGQMDHNYYARPMNDIFTIRAVYNRTVGNDISLSQWQSQFSQDLTSWVSPIQYTDYRVKKLSAVSQMGSASTGNSGGWETWSPYNNGQVSWNRDNTLTNVTLQFASQSGHTDSYLLAYKGIKAVKKSTSYLLRFEATAAAEKKVAVFIRQRQRPYQDITQRYEFMATPSGKTYEFAFTASYDEADALLTFQLGEDNKPLWLNNIRLQEAAIDSIDTDELIRFVYNATAKDSLVELKKPYRDVKNRYYDRLLRLKPFSSAILLRDTLSPVDVRLSMQLSRTVLRVTDVTSVSLTVRAISESATSAGQIQWQCQLPPGLLLVGGASRGLTYQNGMLTGTVQQLLADTTFVFRVKALIQGSFKLSAQITKSTYADPTSTPDSGLDDGEDDLASATFAVRDIVPYETLDAKPGTDAQADYSFIEKSRVYPNPSPDAFTFLTEDAVQSIRLIDLLSRERFRLDNIQEGQRIQFGQSLPDAAYLLLIQYKTGKSQTIKLVKLVH